MDEDGGPERSGPPFFFPPRRTAPIQIIHSQCVLCAPHPCISGQHTSVASPNRTDRNELAPLLRNSRPKLRRKQEIVDKALVCIPEFRLLRGELGRDAAGQASRQPQVTSPAAAVCFFLVRFRLRVAAPPRARPSEVFASFVVAAHSALSLLREGPAPPSQSLQQTFGRSHGADL
jgi:hypothetical protein